MAIRRPTLKPEDIRDSLNETIEVLDSVPKFEFKTLNVSAVASSTWEGKITAQTLSKVNGAMQIASTTTENPSVQFDNTRSVKVTYSFGASTSGLQKMNFLLVGE